MTHPSRERVRVTISLSRELADQIDNLVDGIRIRNRSHAIETLVTDSLEITKVSQAVILAGGEEAIDRLPAIRDMLGSLARQGIADIIIAVGFLGEKIRQEIGDGVINGQTIQYVRSELGTGGALLQIKAKLKRAFLVVNVEQSLDIDLKSLLKFHHGHQPLVTVATKSLRNLTGVYVMEPKAIGYILPGFCMLEDTVFHQIAQEGKLLFYPLTP